MVFKLIYKHKMVKWCILLHITDLHIHLYVFVCLFWWTVFCKPCVCCPVIVPSMSALGGEGWGDIMKMDDAVTVGWCLSQCKHFLLLYYHYHGWCYCYNSHFRKRLSCWDREAENLNGKRRHWNSRVNMSCIISTFTDNWEHTVWLQCLIKSLWLRVWPQYKCKQLQKKVFLGWFTVP